MVSVSAGGNVLATYTYAAGNGKLTRMTYGNGEYEDYTYDNLDRLVKVTYNGSAENAFTVLYDSNGRLAKAVDGKVGITYLYEYDSLDRLIRAYQKDANGNTIFAVENSYDEYGRANGSTYVIDGTEYTYGISYKENTNLVSFYSLPGNSFGYSYDSFDRLTSKINPIYGYTYSYQNGTSLVSSLTVNTNCSGNSDVYSYTYDDLGSITHITKNNNAVSSYEYDALGQLIREDDVVNSKAYVYEYDNAGNILKTYTFDSTGPSASHWMAVYPSVGEITETYTYSDSAWGDLLTNYNGTNISYDSIGNPTNWIGIAALYWDGRELDSITIANSHTVDYTYNSDGIRTRKYEFNGNGQYLYDRNYVLDGSTIVKETVRYSSALNGESTTTLEYYYDESGIASLRYNGTIYYYIKNLQGDVIGILDNSGAAVVEYTYDAWGNILAVTGSLASTVGQANPFRYRGYYYDTETGFYYVSSRYYDPEIGRWINADIPETLTADFENFAQYNLFAYCFNNPVNMSDETGTWPSWAKKVVAAVAVVAVVAAVAAVTVATAGAGTAAAVIAVGAAKGAAIGMASGAAIGAATGAVSHRVSTGSWSGAGTAALNGMGDGALSGAVTGAITGAAGSAVKVSQAAKAWDSGTFKSGYQSMKYHYNKHVVSEGLTKGNNVLKYTQDAVRFANRNSSVLKYTYNYNYGNASWNLTYSTGQGGMFTSAGKILTFWYR